MIDFKQLAEKNHRYAVEMRRHFHRYPELGLEEKNTSRTICRQLEEMGIPYKAYEDYSVIGIINGSQPGKKVAIRADIDALPVEEKTDLPFKSTVPGLMHACGHDSHAGALLAIGKSLNEVKNSLKGTVYLCFQIAEERLRGAKIMVEHLKELGGADHSLAVHVSSSTPLGTVVIPTGSMCAGVVTYVITVKGQGGHGSVPHLAKDPIKPACEIVLRLASLPSNAIDAKDPIVFSTCSVNSGTAPNIIPDTATVSGTVRYFNKELTGDIIDYLVNISNHICTSYGVSREVDYQFNPIMIPVVNNADCAKKGQDIAKAMDLDVVGEMAQMGSDDMALMLDAFPGFYAFVGGANPATGHDPVEAHSAMFDFDEDYMKISAQLLMESAVKLLED